jgi:tRNA-2-methylthio-N6-dimethylallyladenosine synthase
LRLRYTSPHPRHLTRSLIAAHRELEELPRHVHLPVQSGSDRVLKRMIRRHTRAEYLARVARLRAQVPEVTLSTDIIVGFSGETEDDFAQTLSLVEQVGFVGVFGFKYSVRPNTPAQKLDDDVPEAVKGERLQRLFAISERLIREHLAAQVGTTLQVLLEGPSKARPQNATGRSQRNEIVHVEQGASVLHRAGEIVDVEIVEAYKHSLLGRLAAHERERAPAPRAVKRSLPVFTG